MVFWELLWGNGSLESVRLTISSEWGDGSLQQSAGDSSNIYWSGYRFESVIATDLKILWRM